MKNFTNIEAYKTDGKIEYFNRFIADGKTECVVRMDDGTERNLRLFISTNGTTAYKAPRRKNYGRSLWGIAPQIVAVRWISHHKKTGFESYFDNMRKMKTTYTQKAHPNLWSDIRQAYENLNISELELFVKDIVEEGLQDNHYELYKATGEYLKTHELAQGIVRENRYKTTSIKSHNPLKVKGGYGYSQYETCVANIQRHLDNKEDFRYGWRASYDVSVSGKMCDDGVYRAWFSLEFKDCGNGHYYLLINENTAIFAEDD